MTDESGWPFWSLAFFAVIGAVQFPGGTYSTHPLVSILAAGFTFPSAVLSAVMSAAPLALPAFVLAAVFGLYVRYRDVFGDSGFLVVCGCFVAVMAGV